MKRIFMSACFLLTVITGGWAQNTSPYWSLNGNSNATSSSKLGTTNAINLRILTANVERMRITSTGNVGIGTTTPAQRLQVSGNAVFSGRVGVRGDLSGTFALNVNANSSISGINVTNAYDNYVLYGSKTGTGNGIFIYNSLQTNTSTAIYGYNSGPGYGVYGYSYGSGTTVADPYYPAGVFGYNARRGYGVGGYADIGSGVYGYSRNYVGVFGQTGNASSYAGYFAGRVFSTGGFTASDSRLKQDIQEMSSGLEVVKKLSVKSYRFRHDGSYAHLNLPEGRHYGLIAQEVEKILPELVNETQYDSRYGNASMLDSTGKVMITANNKPEVISFKAMNYTELIPVLVRAIQEQQQAIEALTEKVSELSKRNGAVAVNLTSARLGNSSPNPARTSARIDYVVPDESANATMVFTDANGKQLKQVTLSKGNGYTNINTTSLAAGTYFYSLKIDGQVVDTKKLVVAK